MFAYQSRLGWGQDRDQAHDTLHQDKHPSRQKDEVTLDTVCFTICLFISPDLDGHRAPKNDMFACLFRHFRSTFTICFT
jgi:hypothetical protein